MSAARATAASVHQTSISPLNPRFLKLPIV
jgi:hypothetical protein